MRQFSVLAIFGLCLVAAVSAQGPQNNADPSQCEEAWDYLEFLKGNVKDKLESILQDTLFQSRPQLLADTVSTTLEGVLKIREDILNRTKALRTGKIEICPEQGINQDEFLSQLRMNVMMVLLNLIEKGSDNPQKLQDIAKQLLTVRTTVNQEITRMIMLREGNTFVNIRGCECKVYITLEEGLNAITNSSGVTAVGPGGDSGNGGQGGNEVVQLTMILMNLDATIKELYTAVFQEADDEKRNELQTELFQYKEISGDLHQVLSKMANANEQELKRIISREVKNVLTKIRNLRIQCGLKCPGECVSCGAQKIDDVRTKLQEYRSRMESLGEDAKSSIRTDLMSLLNTMNNDMTELLKKKAKGPDPLDKCDNETLIVLNTIKGPLWMLVNRTIFEDAGSITGFIVSLEQQLGEIRKEYCSEGPDGRITIDREECDSAEIRNAGGFIIDIDKTISEHIFKKNATEGRQGAMLGLIDLKSLFETRVRDLFLEDVKCPEEIGQIKNIYNKRVTECLMELMDPAYRFEDIPRQQRVQCIKGLRVAIENRRGLLLMRQIASKITAAAGALPA